MSAVLLIDDHPLIIAGVEGLLSGTEFKAVGRVSDGLDAEALIVDACPDILILDLNLPGRSGLEILRALRSAGDSRRVVLLTAEIDDDSALEAYRLGLDGLVLKDSAPDRLIDCLREVERGGRWIDQSTLQKALSRALEPKTLAEGFDRLSPREREIADHVVSGAPNSQIAAELGISPGTVKVHLHRIYEKLGVRSRADLILHAGRQARPDRA
jgi:two-component system nitrate/nitrite response regulator NarP